MPSRMRHGLLISLVVVSLVVLWFANSHPETVNYIYDELNRLIRVEYEDGTKLIYTYDQTGNRSQVYAGIYALDVTVVGSGTVTKNPDQLVYSAGTSVTLTAVNGSHAFSEWSGDLTGNTNPTAIIMDGDKSVTATFAPPDWLQGWTYRKAVTLSRASGAVTNYQMKLLVGESSGAVGYNVHCNGHVQADFDDLRFTTSDNTILLDYWVESITGTTPNRLATVWVEFDSIGTDATAFYMYYGNAAAPAYSNGPNTFIFFDDFELGNLSRWSTAESQWSVQSSTVRNGTYAAYGAGAPSNRTLAHAITLSDEFCVHYWARPSITSSYVFYGCFSQEVGGSSYLRIPITFGGLAYGKTQYYDGSYKDYSTTLNFTGGTWYEINLFIDLPNNQFRLKYNSTLVNNVTTVFTTDDLTAIRNFCSSSTGRNIYLDDFYIRKWNAIEPTWGSWGPEEAN